MAKLKLQRETIRSKQSPALAEQLAETQLKLQKARVDLAFGRLTKPATISQLRKEVARLQTILKEKEMTNA